MLLCDARHAVSQELNACGLAPGCFRLCCLRQQQQVQAYDTVYNDKQESGKPEPVSSRLGAPAPVAEVAEMPNFLGGVTSQIEKSRDAAKGMADDLADKAAGEKNQDFSTPADDTIVRDLPPVLCCCVMLAMLCPRS